MADIGKELIVVGAVGVGAYLLYQYLQSSCAANPTGTFCSFITPGTTSSTQNTPTNVSNTQASTVQLQTAANVTLAGADDWNVFFRQFMGFGIERIYGFSFDDVYGAVGTDQRSTQ